MMLDSRECRSVAITSIFLVAAVLMVGMVGCTGGAGPSGGEDLPPSENLEIRTWYDLDAIRYNLAGNHTLMNDLDCTTAGYEELAGPTANQGMGWDPIGNSTPTDSGVLYYGLIGTLDGQGHQIRDLFINRPDESVVALLCHLCEGGVVKNVGVVNVTVIAYNWVGALIGGNEGGSVSSCYSSGNVTGQAAVGGLVGRINSGNMSNCYSTGSVTGTSITGIGGLAGQQHAYGGIISNCYSTCSVTAGSVGSGHVGGLVGESYGTVSNSFWDIETSGQTTSDGGTGKNTTEMKNLATFSDVGWDIIAVAANETNSTYVWNIVNNVTYPFLSWQS